MQMSLVKFLKIVLYTRKMIFANAIECVRKSMLYQCCFRR